MDLPPPLRAILDRAPFVMLDGGFASELEALGADISDELWSARILHESPDLARQAHARHVHAGAQLVISSTYQASFEGFATRGLAPPEIERLFVRAVELAREAGAPTVAASLGNYGASRADGSEYRGDYGVDAEVLRGFHARRMSAVGEHADLLAFETVPSHEEIEILLELLAEVRVPVWISMTLRDEATLADGTPLTEIAERLAQAPPALAAVGVNCCPPRFVAGSLEALAPTKLPLVAYPNLGEHWNAEGRCWVAGESPSEWVDEALVRDWVERGARLIGGCCRVGPDHLRALARIRDEWGSSERP